MHLNRLVRRIMLISLTTPLAAAVSDNSLLMFLMYSMAKCMQAMNESRSWHMPVVKDDGALECELILQDFLSFMHLQAPQVAG